MIIDDVCTRLDVLANDARAIDDFEGSSAALDEKIRLAVEHWLQPNLAKHNFDFRKHRTRKTPTHAFSHTGGAWADQTAAAADGTGIALASVFAAANTDSLYVGLDRPFGGLFFGFVDSVNNVAIAASLTHWTGQWSSMPSSLANGTILGSVPFARAGRITWPTPPAWLTRDVNDEGPLYWVRLQVNSTPAAACVLGQLLPIVRSRLTQPTALKALALTYREGAGGSRGDWMEKAKEFETLAATHLEMVVPLIGDEFDVDDDGAVTPTEVNSLTREPWTWQRG